MEWDSKVDIWAAGLTVRGLSLPILRIWGATNFVVQDLRSPRNGKSFFRKNRRPTEWWTASSWNGVTSRASASRVHKTERQVTSVLGWKRYDHNPAIADYLVKLTNVVRSKLERIYSYPGAIFWDTRAEPGRGWPYCVLTFPTIGAHMVTWREASSRRSGTTRISYAAPSGCRWSQASFLMICFDNWVVWCVVYTHSLSSVWHSQGPMASNSSISKVWIIRFVREVL